MNLRMIANMLLVLAGLVAGIVFTSAWYDDNYGHDTASYLRRCEAEWTNRPNVEAPEPIDPNEDEAEKHPNVEAPPVPAPE